MLAAWTVAENGFNSKDDGFKLLIREIFMLGSFNKSF